MTKIEKRGWNALAVKLREKGLSCAELEEAHSLFNKGIGLLAGLFLLSRQKLLMKHEKNITER